MKKLTYIKLLVFILLASATMLSCKKQWLEAKPDKSLAVPTTIADFQAILDNNNLFNEGDCILDEVGAGDFYTSDANWGSLSIPYLKTSYIWASDIFEGNLDNISDWADPYTRVFTANVVLEGIEEISPQNSIEQAVWNNVKGTALFYRAYNHYSIAKCFCKVYDKNTANTDLGIPIRVQSDINIPSVRSSVQESYDQIISDLKLAFSTLSVATPISNVYRIRPTKTAAAAMLARIYLAMSNYDSAFVYADKALLLYNTLMDYGTMTTSGTTPFASLNAEVIFNMAAINYSIFTQSRLVIDSLFYKSFSDNDKRKEAFFTPPPASISVKRSYLGSTLRFTGLATDELYLIRAECNARKGNVPAAMQDLNGLMIKRWKNNGTWTPFTASDATQALQIILTERRKELCFRGIRWNDLRRLNKESQFVVTLTRVTNSQTYTLPPNDPRYVLPIPPGVIVLTNMPQNPR